MPVTLASSNTFSHDTRETTFGAYLASVVDRPVQLEDEARATFYMFGDSRDEAWEALSARYPKPPHLAKTDGAPSFGVGGRWSGVPMHLHGGGWSHVIHGRKLWWLYPRGVEPRFSELQTSLQYATHVLPKLSPDKRPPHACVIGPGELLYFPDRWMHGTLNLDAFNVFMSVFD